MNSQRRFFRSWRSDWKPIRFLCFECLSIHLRSVDKLTSPPPHPSDGHESSRKFVMVLFSYQLDPSKQCQLIVALQPTELLSTHSHESVPCLKVKLKVFGLQNKPQEDLVRTRSHYLCCCLWLSPLKNSLLCRIFHSGSNNVC